jgi:hypothetical protein
MKLADFPSKLAAVKRSEGNMLAVVALTLLQAGASPEVSRSETIIVTGTRLDDDRERLEQCLARRCPPLEDIAATLRYAENLFVAGDYQEARRVLTRAIDRNRGESAQYPRAVAGLFRAHARVAIHLGEAEDYRRSSHAMLRSLSDGLPDDSPDVLLGRLEVGDMHLGLANLRQAQLSYERTERAAREAGRPGIAALARLRAAWFLHLSGRSDRARSELERMIESPGEGESAVYRLAARVVLARIARAEGDREALDALVAELARTPTGQALTLIWSPPLGGDRPGRVFRDEPRLALSNIASEGFADRWADIGYWVRPDGTVADAEILRIEGSDDWTEPLLRSIAGRLYAPFEDEPGSPGRYRVERFTYTSLWVRPAGTRIRTRSGAPRIESLDLTPVEAPAEGE